MPRNMKIDIETKGFLKATNDFARRLGRRPDRCLNRLASWVMSPCWMRLIGLQNLLDFGPSLGFEIGPLKRGY